MNDKLAKQSFSKLILGKYLLNNLDVYCRPKFSKLAPSKYKEQNTNNTDQNTCKALCHKIIVRIRKITINIMKVGRVALAY